MRHNLRDPKTGQFVSAKHFKSLGGEDNKTNKPKNSKVKLYKFNEEFVLAVPNDSDLTIKLISILINGFKAGRFSNACGVVKLVMTKSIENWEDVEELPDEIKNNSLFKLLIQLTNELFYS